MVLSKQELYEFLEEKHDRYNRTSFIENDPVVIPHLFSKKEDIEIAGFLTAIIAWGQRPTIINNANKLIKWMGDSPHDFIINAQSADLKTFENFTHRTFNGIDCVYFIKSLQNIYKNHGGLETIIKKFTNKDDKNLKNAIMGFRSIFFELPYPARTLKHFADPSANSAAKRLNMFLRWMVRKDDRGVDFGIWDRIKMSQLCCPLDIHSGTVARKLGLLQRKQDDWKAVIELTGELRRLDSTDPVKYDFALFGLGVVEKF